MGFGKDGKGAILIEADGITLGTLADRTAVKANAQLAIQDDFRIIKTEVKAMCQGLTAQEYPVYFGIADHELSVAEIKECLDTDGPLDRNDRVAVERAERPVWLLGQFGRASSSELIAVEVEKTLRWTFSNPEGWTFFAFNHSGGALTTGGSIRFQAKHFGVWVT